MTSRHTKDILDSTPTFRKKALFPVKYNKYAGGGNVSGAIAGTQAWISTALNNAKIGDTSEIEQQIENNRSLAFNNSNINTNDQLMQAWDQYSPLNPVTAHEIRGMSGLGKVGNSLKASAEGAAAGMAAGGPWGALIGGVVGLGAGIGGVLVGDAASRRIRDKLNRQIARTNELAYESLSQTTSDVAQKNLWRAEDNYIAYGGSLDNPSLDKRFASRQLQELYGNGIPSRTFELGGQLPEIQTNPLPIGKENGIYIFEDTPTPEQLAARRQYSAMFDEEDLVDRSTPYDLVKRFDGGGNVAVSVKQRKYVSPIETLLPFIQRVQADKQRKEELAAERKKEEQEAAYKQEMEDYWRQMILDAEERERNRFEAERPSSENTSTSAYNTQGEYSRKELIDSIKKFEGFLSRPKWDVNGYAIGYGDHDAALNNYYLKNNEEYTEELAEEQLVKRIMEFRDILSREIPGWDELTGPQQDALTSYGYNAGPYFLRKSPKLRKALEARDWANVAANMDAGWNMRDDNGRILQGLRDRRLFERLAFLHPNMTVYGVIPEEDKSAQLTEGQKNYYNTISGNYAKEAEGEVANAIDSMSSMHLTNPYSKKTTPSWLDLPSLSYAYGGNIYEDGTETLQDPPEESIPLIFKDAPARVNPLMRYVNNAVAAYEEQKEFEERRKRQEANAKKLFGNTKQNKKIELFYRDIKDIAEQNKIKRDVANLHSYINNQELSPYDVQPRVARESTRAYNADTYVNPKLRRNFTDEELAREIRNADASIKASSWIPILGAPAALYEAGKDIEEGKYLSALGDVAAQIPGVGLLSKPAKVANAARFALAPGERAAAWFTKGRLLPDAAKILNTGRAVDLGIGSYFTAKAADNLIHGRGNKYENIMFTLLGTVPVLQRLRYAEAPQVIGSGVWDPIAGELPAFTLPGKETKTWESVASALNGVSNTVKRNLARGQVKFRRALENRGIYSRGDFRVNKKGKTNVFFDEDEALWKQTLPGKGVNYDKNFFTRSTVAKINNDLKDQEYIIPGLPTTIAQQVNGKEKPLSLINRGLLFMNNLKSDIKLQLPKYKKWYEEELAKLGGAHNESRFVQPLANLRTWDRIYRETKANLLTEIKKKKETLEYVKSEIQKYLNNPSERFSYYDQKDVDRYTKWIAEDEEKLKNLESAIQRERDKFAKNFPEVDFSKDGKFVVNGKYKIEDEAIDKMSKGKTADFYNFPRFGTSDKGYFSDPTPNSVYSYLKKYNLELQKVKPETISKENGHSIVEFTPGFTSSENIIFLKKGDQHIIPAKEVGDYYVTVFGEQIPKSDVGYAGNYSKIPSWEYGYPITKMETLPGEPIEFKPIIPEQQQEAATMLRKAQEALGNEAFIEGSTQTISHGAFAGSPNDLEVTFPRSWWDTFIDRIGLDKSYKNLSSKNITPPAGTKAAEITGGRPFDIHFTDEYQKIIYNFARTLDPKKFEKLRSTLAKQGKSITFEDIQKAYGDVFKDLKKKDLEYLNVLTDALVNRKVFSMNHSKGSGSYGPEKFGRPLQMLMNPDKEVAKAVSKSIDIIRHSVFGENHKLLSELNPNFDFGNVEANKKFLEYLGIGKKTQDLIAGNKETMKNLIEYFHMQKTGLYRSTQNLQENGIVGNIGLVNYAPRGGTGSGGGGNNVGIAGITSHGDYEWFKQLPLTYHYENIKNAEDLVKTIKRLDRAINKEPFNGKTLQEWDDILAGKNNPAENAKFARENDFPIMFDSNNEYAQGTVYVGQYAPEEDILAYSLAKNGSRSPISEAGRDLAFYKKHLTQPVTETVTDKENFTEFGDQLHRLLDRGKKLDRKNYYVNQLLSSNDPQAKKFAEELLRTEEAYGKVGSDPQKLNAFLNKTPSPKSNGTGALEQAIDAAIYSGIIGAGGLTIHQLLKNTKKKKEEERKKAEKESKNK